MRLLIITLTIFLASCQGDKSIQNEADVINYQESLINLEKHLELMNSNIEIKTELIQTGIEFSYVIDKRSAKRNLDASNKVDSITNELISYIDYVKREVINVTDLGWEQIDAVYGDTIALINIKNKNNIDSSTYYFMEDNNTEGKGEAPEMKVELDLYIIELKEILNDLGIKKGRYRNLNKIESFTQNSNGDSWAKSNFYNKPLISTITSLTQIENQIRITEMEVLLIIKEYINLTHFRFDKLEARLISQPEKVNLGGDYEAEIILSAWSSTTPYKIIIGPTSQLDHSVEPSLWFKPNSDTTQILIKNGDAKFTIPAKLIEKQEYSILVQVKNTNTGEIYVYNLFDSENNRSKIITN